jgi:hypothetical protein
MKMAIDTPASAGMPTTRPTPPFPFALLVGARANLLPKQRRSLRAGPACRRDRS